MMDRLRRYALRRTRCICLFLSAASIGVSGHALAPLASAFQRSLPSPAGRPVLVMFDAKKGGPKKAGLEEAGLEEAGPEEAGLEERQKFVAIRELVRGSLQQELAVIDRLVGLEREAALKLLGLVEHEWEAKLADPLQSNMFRNRAPVREALVENAMIDWLGQCAAPEDLKKYLSEVDRRAIFRIHALQEQLLDMMQQRYSLTESQVVEFGDRLREMQPLRDRVMAIRQLTESAQHRLVAPLVNSAYGDRLITSAQRNAVARNELGTVQASYPEGSPRVGEEVGFRIGNAQLQEDVGGATSPEQTDEPNRAEVVDRPHAIGRGVGREMGREIAAVQRANPNVATIHGRLSKSELEEMLYGLVGGSRQAFRVRRKDDIQRQVDRIQFVCKLTELQQDKIAQAVEIEIERNISEIASLLSGIDDETSPEKKQQVYFQAHQELLQMQLKGHFEASSLWEKVVRSTLTPEQHRLLGEEEARKKARQSKLEKELLLLNCQQHLGLIEVEREQLLGFLNLPDQNSVVTVDDCRSALAELTQEERRKVLPDSVWKQWE